MKIQKKKGGLNMGKDCNADIPVKVINVYNLAQTSWLFQVLKEHYDLVLLHINCNAKKALINECNLFYEKWNGSKSAFIQGLHSVLTSMDYNKAGAIEFLPYIYNNVWRFLCKYVNGRDGIMDEEYWDSVIETINNLTCSSNEMEKFEIGLYNACIDLIETHYREEKSIAS